MRKLRHAIENNTSWMLLKCWKWPLENIFIQIPLCSFLKMSSSFTFLKIRELLTCFILNHWFSYWTNFGYYYFFRLIILTGFVSFLIFLKEWSQYYINLLFRKKNRDFLIFFNLRHLLVELSLFLIHWKWSTGRPI